MEVLFEKISHNQVKVYDPYADFAEVCTDPDILLLSGGTALNEIIRRVPAQDGLFALILWYILKTLCWS